MVQISMAREVVIDTVNLDLHKPAAILKIRRFHVHAVTRKVASSSTIFASPIFVCLQGKCSGLEASATHLSHIILLMNPNRDSLLIKNPPSLAKCQPGI
jgi:hypothetical protein